MSSRGFTPGRTVAVAINTRHTGRSGASWIRQRKQELRISISAARRPIGLVGKLHIC